MIDILIPGKYEWPLGDTLAVRFAAKHLPADVSGCMIWTAFRNPRGYGMIRNGSRMALAHRVAWVLHHESPIEGTLNVLHTCDTPACVNPDHLYLGTNADNIRDKVERGRSRFRHPERQGEKHPLAILSNREVSKIRSRFTGRRGEQKELAAEFGVSRATICNIKKGKSWNHL